jgi:transposase-like protein
MDTSTQVNNKSSELGTKRRKWSPEERQTIVRASQKSGTTVDSAARMYGVNASQIHDWRK